MLHELISICCVSLHWIIQDCLFHSSSSSLGKVTFPLCQHGCWDSSRDKTSEFCVSIHKSQIVPHLLLPLGPLWEKWIPPLLRSSDWVRVIHGTGLNSQILLSGILLLHSHWVGCSGTEVGHSAETLSLIEGCPGMLSRRWSSCTARAVLQAVIEGSDWWHRNNREEDLAMRHNYFFKLVLQKLFTQLWYLYCLRSRPSIRSFCLKKPSLLHWKQMPKFIKIKHKFAWFYLPHESVQDF